MWLRSGPGLRLPHGTACAASLAVALDKTAGHSGFDAAGCGAGLRLRSGSGPGDAAGCGDGGVLRKPDYDALDGSVAG